MDVWDYFYKQNDPTLSLQIDADGLRCLKIQDAGSLLATGSVDGSVYMLELCESLVTPQPNEKLLVGQMFERESKREKNLEARLKELRQKEKRASELAAQGDQGGDKTPWEETVKGIEDQFWQSVGGKDSGDVA